MSSAPKIQPTNPRSGILISYFRSGWAFLIPYLATYLLYAWLKWPVNPGTSGEGLVKGMSESGTVVGSQRSAIPPLLHVYWFLHGLHLMLGVMALRTWWRNTYHLAINSQLAPNTPTARHRLYAVIPWLGLALIFWIPGTYLEWPADPWEHFRRITEWATHSTAGAHSAGYKSFYFFAYSFLVDADPAEQITRLDLYSTLISLLLAWQYYRLAKTVGLDSRWAFISVLANVCLFGNVCFSFYRYYALASTMYSQLGAVALVRIVCEAAQSPELSPRSFSIFLPAGRSQTLKICGLLFSSILLLALITSNHVQGIGIAGLSLVSILVWRTLQGKSSRILWIAGGGLALSIATYLWWPHHPTVDNVYRPGRWLNAWYGFNFAWPSPSADRAMQILGVSGIINLLAGIVLLRRNHIVGWLTVGPVVALALPFVSLPFANRLAANGTDEIIIFHRMLFAIPSGLALVFCGNELAIRRTIFPAKTVMQPWGFIAMATISMALVSLAPAGPYNNRFWHFIRVTASDLQLKPMITSMMSATRNTHDIKNGNLIATEAITNVFNVFAPSLYPFRDRKINQPASISLEEAVALISSSKPTTGRDGPTQTLDPLATDRHAWISITDATPKLISGIRDFRASQTALQNSPGQALEILTFAKIPLEREESYQVEISLRQVTGTDATAYVAIAWYNETGEMLNSSVALPKGAGNPVGWHNGTYSYFGIFGSVAPANWTTYRFSFGHEQAAIIPTNAKYLRVGALLNYNAVPNAVIQMTNIRLWKKKSPEIVKDGSFQNYGHHLIIIPSLKAQFSPASQTGQTSQHWPAQELATDLAGNAELKAATLKADTKSERNEGIIFELAEVPF